MAKSISVVIPCWNSESQLQKNLPSVLVAAQKVNAEVIIVDDYSQKDNSYKYLQSLGSQISLYQNSSNQGFGYTVNRGVDLAQGEVVVLLNTDVRPDPACLVALNKYFQDANVFAVTFNSGEGAMRISWQKGLFQHYKYDIDPHSDKVVYSAWASGGQAAFDRSKWQQLKGMDLLFSPFYWEDTDLGYRAWKKGWQIIWGKDCHCVHDHGASVITGNFGDNIKTDIARRNQFLFVWKNSSDFRLLISHYFWLPYYLWQYPRTLAAALTKLPSALKSRSISRRLWQKNDKEILKIWE